jgi:putative SOS response-associated peptidase YedK
MCFHNSINTDKTSVEKKYKKKLKDSVSFNPIFHASGFEFGKWPIVANFSEISDMNWGLIPSWAKSSKDAGEIKAKTLNARGETFREKASFKNAFPCLVPSTGFFEWKLVGNSKIPYFIYLKNAEIFSMAGVFDKWVNEKGEINFSFSILTTEANSLMAEIHNVKKRMPIILKSENEDKWLNGTLEEKALIQPFDSHLMDAHAISSVISSKNHNVREVSLPQTHIVSEQLSLF